MTISGKQLLEALHLVNQMFHDSLNSFIERHMVWRSAR